MLTYIAEISPSREVRERQSHIRYLGEAVWKVLSDHQVSTSILGSSMCMDADDNLAQGSQGVDGTWCLDGYFP